MKKIINFLFLVSIVFALGDVTDVFAANNGHHNDKHHRFVIRIEDDMDVNEMEHISTETYTQGDKLVKVDVYEQEDGTVITDTLTMNAVSLLSAEGSDEVIRTRNISGWGTITIKARFSWYTEGWFSYVRCDSMTDFKSLDSRVSVKKWELNYTKDYVPLGKAKAQIEYKLVNPNVPFQFQTGTFKITCTDTGTISDNGD